MPATTFPGWQVRWSQRSCKSSSSEFLSSEYFQLQRSLWPNFFAFIGQSRNPHTEAWTGSKDHTEPWLWLRKNYSSSKAGGSSGNSRPSAQLCSLAGLSAQHKGWESSLPSIHALFNSSDKWASNPGRSTSQRLQPTMYSLLPARSFVCKPWSRLSFLSREGRTSPPTRAAGRISNKRMAQQNSSYLGAGCGGFRFWSPVDYIPQRRRESCARIISWQAPALARESKGEYI